MHPEQMHGGALQGRKIDAIRFPGQQTRIFIEGVCERHGRAAGGRHHRQPRVEREVPRVAHGRGEGDPGAVGRPDRRRVRAGLVHDLRHRVVREVQQVDVRAGALHQVGIHRGAEGDPGAVGRPGEVADAEIAPLRPLHAGGGRFQGFLHVDRPEMGVAVVAADHPEITQVLRPVLVRRHLRLLGEEGDLAAVRRPLVISAAVLDVGDPHRLAPVRADEEQLVLAAVPARHERQPAAVRRPLRVAGAVVAAGELEGASGGRLRQPDLRRERILLEVGRQHRVGHPAAVRRDFDQTRHAQLQQLVHRGHVPRRRRLGGQSPAAHAKDHHQPETGPLFIHGILLGLFVPVILTDR